MGEYKVLITTSGLGSRLGDLTSFTNKALVRVGDKPSISHIIENYDEDIEIVVTVGHYKNHVVDFLQLAYPERKFTFVEVEKFKGEGSSLGLSMFCAREHLQCPFVFNVCDALVKEGVRAPNVNWVGGCLKQNNSQYRAIVSQGENFHKFKEKGESREGDLAYVGLCGIKDYDLFWDELEFLTNNETRLDISDCHVINRMASSGTHFEITNCKTWLDTGNTAELHASRSKLHSEMSVLDKVDENIFMINDSVIKFFHNKNISKKRVSRASALQGIVPKITGHQNNFYKYKKVEGELFSRTVTEKSFDSFLEWCFGDLWQPTATPKNFEESCASFYFDKTQERLLKFHQITGLTDKKETINNLECKPAKEVLSALKKYKLEKGTPCKFHGDCILDNVIETEGQFTLIDWRQDFAGGEIGDVYYDLAKLNHNLTFNHDLVAAGHYSVDFLRSIHNEHFLRPTGIKVDILQSNRLLRCREVLYSFMLRHGYDVKKVEILTSLIWLNMAPLHDGNLKFFLFYFGKFYLNKYVP